MRTTFKNLDIGQRFEFVIKSDLCDGFYNGIGIKLSRLDYRMSGENVTIFDVNAAVFGVESAKLASAAVPVLTMESAAKIMDLKIRPGEPDDLTIAQLIRQRADLLAALEDFYTWLQSPATDFLTLTMMQKKAGRAIAAAKGGK